MIPKTIYFYWDEGKMSYMRWLSVYSFRLFHPDWEINVIKRRTHNIDTTKYTEAQDKYTFNGKDFFDTLSILNVNIIDLEDMLPELAEFQLPPQMTSDILSWYILAYKGGVVSDMDIIYYKPIEYRKYKDIDAGLICFSGNPKPNYVPVSFMIGNHQEIFAPIFRYCMENYDRNIYESCGTNAFNAVYGSFNGLLETFSEVIFANKYKIVQLPSQLVFPFSERSEPWDWYFPMMYQTRMKIPETSIGMHWYAGHPMSQKINTQFDILQHTLSDSTFFRMVKEIESLPRVSIFNCVSNALEMLKFSSKGILENAGYNDFDYIIVHWNASEEVMNYLHEIEENHDNVILVEYNTNPNV